MSETQITPWDQINVDENLTEADHAASTDISQTAPIGKFVCLIVGCDAVEKNFKNYSCYAANLKCQIEEVLRIEKPLLDDKGAQVKRDGEVVMKVVDVPEDEKGKMNALYGGRFLFEAINLHNPLEKDSMKNRRIYVAKQIGLISSTATNLPTSVWPKAVGRKVIITTEKNTWQDQQTKEVKSNVRVAWDGFSAYVPTNTNAGSGEKTNNEADTSFNPEDLEKEFDI